MIRDLYCIKRWMYSGIVLLLSCLLGACIAPGIDPNSTEASARRDVSYLTEDYARLRSSQIDNVSYNLDITLSATAPEFTGTNEITFDLLNNDQALTLDFNDGSIQEVHLNNRQITFDYNGKFLTINPQVLEAGKQHLLIKYSHPYSNTGSGLYRFIDPEDNRTYLYTDFEPYDANRLFPAFDQPDLKASYQLSVIAPAAWQVISSVYESNIIEQGDSRRWVFPPSKKFSTYIFSLHAGDYQKWESVADGIPMRLFVRHSMAAYVEKETWFDATRRGLTFYQQYFNIKYPFEKYDQLIVPDFNAGAMENVAAVTFAERFIQRGEYTQEDTERIINVILHEMAHMWFGDLVTMRWWNGLWLNESFATYMSYLAMEENQANPAIWQRFYSRSKLWAYETDEQVTTHPIELPVDNTESAFANFDGITYGKGASVLKQLSYLIGHDNFRNGVSQYLGEHAYGNTELDDFISTLSVTSGMNLDAWKDEWLYKAGLNTVMIDFSCDKDMLTKLILHQDSKLSPRTRTHKLQLGFYNADSNNRIVLTAVQPLLINAETTTVSGLSGQPCPDFIYPNQDDWAYIKFSPSVAELKYISTEINRFDDPLTRAMLWRNLREAAKDARMPLTDYTNVVLAKIGDENDPYILMQIFEDLDDVLNYFYRFDMQDNSLANGYASKLEELFWKKIHDFNGNSYLQSIWYDAYEGLVHTPTAQKKLIGLLSGEIVVPGLQLDQDRRWELVKRLSLLGNDHAAELLLKEVEKDPSQQGQLSRIAAEAAYPDMENKKEWLARIHREDSDFTLAMIRSALSRLYPDTQISYRKALLRDVLAHIPMIDRTRESQYVRAYAADLIKGYCSDESSLLLQNTIQQYPSVSLSVVKALNIALQEDQRCIQLKELVNSQSAGK